MAVGELGPKLRRSLAHTLAQRGAQKAHSLSLHQVWPSQSPRGECPAVTSYTEGSQRHRRSRHLPKTTQLPAALEPASGPSGPTFILLRTTQDVSQRKGSFSKGAWCSSYVQGPLRPAGLVSRSSCCSAPLTLLGTQAEGPHIFDGPLRPWVSQREAEALCCPCWAAGKACTRTACTMARGSSTSVPT